MLLLSIYLLAGYLLLLQRVLSCLHLELTSPSLGTLALQQLPGVPLASPQAKERPSYISNDEDNDPSYALEFQVSDDHQGEWKLLEQAKVVASIPSWSPLPSLIPNTNDLSNKPWIAHDLSFDSSIQLTCTDQEEHVIYLESLLPIAFQFNGFYIHRLVQLTNDTTHVYIQLNGEHLLYFHLDKWIISKSLYSEHGEAYTMSSIFTSDSNPLPWRMSHGSIDIEMRVVSRNQHESIYQAINNARRGSDQRVVNGPMEHRILRNGIAMPVIGLGTGGIYLEQMKETFIEAYAQGYRLFDLAREYQNEELIGELLLEQVNGILRNDVILQTKVWPTELGFEQTTRAISASLQDLKTPYIDSYLIHWPRCYPDWDWMHCETTVDHTGTWEGSWKALEKAYAEGLVMSIGVSNFDLSLLEQLQQVAIVLPHIVQNFAEPGRIDRAVQEWCFQHGVAYQPYASLRNMKDLPMSMLRTLEAISESKHRSQQQVILRYFYQLGNIGIPRASKAEHMADNIAIFNFALTEDEMERITSYDQVEINSDEEL